ncbi:MAG: hypothetical protein ABIJ50_03195 [Pseudomonadota bacterium]
MGKAERAHQDTPKRRRVHQLPANHPRPLLGQGGGLGRGGPGGRGESGAWAGKRNEVETPKRGVSSAWQALGSSPGGKQLPPERIEDLVLGLATIADYRRAGPALAA